MDGWIKLHRTLVSHDLWLSEPFTRGQAWVDLLLLANAKPGAIWVRGIKVPVDAGQVAWSVQSLATRWKWSRGKVQRLLDDFQKDLQIEHQKNSVTSLLSITNWEQYQGNGQQTDSRRTADGQQTDTNKKDKKDKKDKNKNILSDDSIVDPPSADPPANHPDEGKIPTPPYQQILALYHAACTSMPRVHMVTDTRRTAMKQRWVQFKGDLRAFEVLFASAAASEFLSGRSGRWTGCNFDWLLKQSNMVKVLEGNYDNGK